MRTIKFRGKFVYAITNGPLMGSLQWVYGDLFQSVTLSNVGKAKIFETIPYNDSTLVNDREVLKGTVGQFTGVHDKNGKEIYEGDIIRAFDSKGNQIKHEIYYLESEARFATKLIGYDSLNEGELSQKWVDEIGFEIIGNTFDNPELLRNE